MKFAILIFFLLMVLFVSAQDTFIRKAVDQCCDCFANGGKTNQDSVFVDCSIKAVSNNIFGLMSDLSGKYAEDKNFSLENEMIKHFKKCKSIRKYYYKKHRAEKKQKKKA